eukprot:TRINITY_DN93283_c0_g1_i1.p1 TRINITY_DN93283_c0_g1~~TRINITY_DN93283_c0_g1_i1.p1  ORF type:complete len:190 (-),score=53.83 TRINITY_DN93283_c0_g1_i1:242-811(-)
MQTMQPQMISSQTGGAAPFASAPAGAYNPSIPQTMIPSQLPAGSSSMVMGGGSIAPQTMAPGSMIGSAMPGPIASGVGMPPMTSLSGAPPPISGSPAGSLPAMPMSVGSMPPLNMSGPPLSMEGQYMPNVARPQMTGVANPPMSAGNIQYGPSYKMQYQKRSSADKSAVKYTGFLPLEGVYEEDTCRVG